MGHFERFLEAYPKYKKEQDGDQFEQLFSVIAEKLPDAKITFASNFGIFGITVFGHFQAVEDFKLVRRYLLQYVPTEYRVNFSFFPIYPESVVQELQLRDQALSCMV